MSEQILFGTDSFVDNPEPRCPCMLLLDISGSMAGSAIAELNAGLTTFKDELAADSLAMKRVEVGIITFGPVRTEAHFQTAASFYPPTLTSQGDTPMGEAIRQGIAMVNDRKAEYRRNGIAYYRPWIWLITDGGPTDEWQSAAFHGPGRGSLQEICVLCRWCEGRKHGCPSPNQCARTVVPARAQVP